MKFTKTTLPNGLRLITVPSADAPTVTMLVSVEAGSKYETKEINGLSHFLEHMCFKGTEKRPNAIDISRELDSIGAHYNAMTSQEFTGYYAKTHPKHLPILIDVISDMYLNPVFKETEIEKEKGVIVQEIKMYEDMPQRHVQDVFLELMYGDQPAGWNIAGTPELVKSWSREHFINYRNSHYVASSTIVAIAGNFDEKKVLADIERAFAAISTGPKTPKLVVSDSQTTPAIKIVDKKTDQAHLVLGVRAYGAKDGRVPALKVLNAVIGGGMSARLFQKMRDEMGVCYYVRSGSDEYTDHGNFTVSAGVDTKRVGESIDAIIKEFKRLRDEPVGEAELSKAKEQIIGGLYLGLESSDAIAEFTSFQEIVRGAISTPEEMSAKISAVTPAEVQAVAQDIFIEQHLNLALIGAVEKPDELKNMLSF